jgi:hypothetical protein
MTTDNLNILAIAAPESNMARQRAHRKKMKTKEDYKSENYHYPILRTVLL